ncbi:MAG: SufD family Fe-S cluster assembly protein [Candidatus Gygaella obscura]|nr:SufD family Fe-S cluster assembly protein [Candidatus Gygaella obscura]
MKNVKTALSEKVLKPDLEKQDLKSIASSGMDFTQRGRSGSFLQSDNKIEFMHSLYDGLDIMDIETALKKIPDAKKYYTRAFKDLKKDFPKDTKGGYFIRVKKGTVLNLPIQACLFLKKKSFKQRVHNVIVIEEGARVYLITGCSASKAASDAHHLGISEFFVNRGAYLNFTMIHSWKEDISVRPMSVAMVEENATFISNYISLKPVKDIKMYPTAVLKGAYARASFNSLILSHPDSLHDIGSRVVFKAKNTQAEVVSRAISLGGKVIARGHLKAEAPQVKAHLECRGLIISQRGTIHAVPEMESDYRDVNMSHEAAIGKINNEEIEYLCSRGFTKNQAQSIIVRGFMDVDVLGLPQELKKEVEDLENKTLESSF